LRQMVGVAMALFLSGCVSERQFLRDSLPFGNPNAPVAGSETAQRALGHDPAVAPITPQAGNVWPGPVQPVPTLSDEQQDMNEPLGQAYTPSLPSPYPPGEEPPPDADLGFGPLGEPGTQTFAQPGVQQSPAGSGTGVQPGIVTSPAAPSPAAPSPAAPSPPAGSPSAP
jgi:hypothetical protein